MNTNLPHFELSEKEFQTCVSALTLAENMMVDILKIPDISPSDRFEIIQTLHDVIRVYRRMNDFLESMQVIQKAQQSAAKPAK